MKNALRLLRRARELAVFYLRGGVAYARTVGATVGHDCRLYTHRLGTEPFLITIGDRVTVTHGVVFLTHDGAAGLVRDARGRRYRYARITIGNDVFIGVNSLILPGVAIGNRVIVRAGAVVTRSVPEGSIVVGAPARIVGAYDAYAAAALARFPARDASLARRPYRDQVLAMLDPTMRPPLNSPPAAAE